MGSLNNALSSTKSPANAFLWEGGGRGDEIGGVKNGRRVKRIVFHCCAVTFKGSDDSLFPSAQIMRSKSCDFGGVAEPQFFPIPFTHSKRNGNGRGSWREMLQAFRSRCFSTSTRVPTLEVDYLVVGSGIAGAGAALAASKLSKRVLVVERENAHCVHSTGIKLCAVF